MNLAEDARDWFLRSDVKLQPLFCRWPLWPHLVAPAQAAMNLAFRYLPSLQSFVSNPSIHASAAHHPAMFGGPFVALPMEDVPRVAELLGESQRKCAALLEFAQQLRALDERLQRDAIGFRLDEYYATLPPVLGGLVELVYDLNNHALVKIFEALAYDTFQRSDCWELCVHQVKDIDRPFFMSTPVLDSSQHLVLQMPLTDQRIDLLARSRIQPCSAPDLIDQLQLDAGTAAKMARLFTRTNPDRDDVRYRGSGVRVRYFGHACVLVETREVAVLFDPVTAWDRDAEAALTFADLPDFIDFVILTHCHQDHCHPEVLVQLRQRVGEVLVPSNDPGNLADPSLKLILRHLGYSRVRAMDAFDTVEIAGGTITSIPFVGEHAGLNIASKHCIGLSLQGKQLLFLVDTDLMDAHLCRRLFARLGAVDAIFIGMECHGAPLSWLYGPLLTKPMTRRDDESRRLSGSDCERAWNAVEAFGCRDVYVYAMGQESWLRGLMGLQYEPGSVQLVESDRFVERCRSRGIRARRLAGCSELKF